MARSRRSAPAPARKSAPSTPAKAPAVQQSAPAPAPTAQPPSVGGGLMATVAEGLAFGTGSAIARHAVNAAVDSFSGSGDKAAAAAPSAPSATPSAAQTCLADKKAFTDCLERNASDIASCQFFLDAFNSCQQQQQSAFV